MPDFSQFMSKPAGEAKRPPALPQGDYPGVVKSFELGDANKNKTPYVRFHLGLTDWAQGVEPEADVELTKRQLRRDYYLTEDALWRLDEFIRSCGVQPAGQTYEEILPSLVGASVTVEVQQQLNQTSNEIFNQVGKVVGQAAAG
jgi:hypothetical protein